MTALKDIFYYLLAALCIVQFLVAFASGSLAMYYDSLYVFMEVATFTALNVADTMTKRFPNPNYPLGYHQAPPTAQLVMVVLHWLFIFGLFHASIRDFFWPTHTNFQAMFFFCSISSVIQFMSHLVHWREPDTTVATEEGNVAALKESVTDLFKNRIAPYCAFLGLLVTIGAPCNTLDQISVSRWNVLDPVLCIVFLFLALKQTVASMNRAIDKLLLKAPKSVNAQCLENALLASCRTIKDVQDIRYFQIGNEIILYAQLAVQDRSEEDILEKSRAAVAKLGVTQSTFQMNLRQKKKG